MIGIQELNLDVLRDEGDVYDEGACAWEYLKGRTYPLLNKVSFSFYHI
jgi:hypothetical protein